MIKLFCMAGRTSFRFAGSVCLETNAASKMEGCSTAIQKSSVMYGYKCHCDSRYVGRTSQRLQDSIKQHVSKRLRQHTASQRVQTKRASRRRQLAPECDSATGRHLSENDQRAVNYNNDQYSILDSARSPFHLSLLEASYIRV